jgi:hypothetical protein
MLGSLGHLSAFEAMTWASLRSLIAICRRRLPCRKIHMHKVEIRRGLREIALAAARGPCKEGSKVCQLQHRNKDPNRRGTAAAMNQVILVPHYIRQYMSYKIVSGSLTETPFQSTHWQRRLVIFYMRWVRPKDYQRLRVGCALSRKQFNESSTRRKISSNMAFVISTER